MIQMKKMAAAVAIAAASIGGAQAVTTGDVLFSGVASNASSVSQFSLTTFADLVEGTVISITDSNFKQNGASSPYGFVGSIPNSTGAVVVSGTPESVMQWTVGAGGLAAGTSIDFTFNSTTPTATASLGTIAISGTNTSGFSGTADSLWAYIAGPGGANQLGTMISGLTTYNSGTGDNLAATITASGLATGSTDVSLYGVGGVTTVKYAYYNGATTFDTLAAAKSAYANTAFWSVSNVAASAALPVSGFTITAAVPEASTYAMLLAGLGMIGFMARRRSV